MNETEWVARLGGSLGAVEAGAWPWADARPTTLNVGEGILPD